jgi:hypothetical protein
MRLLYTQQTEHSTYRHETITCAVLAEASPPPVLSKLSTSWRNFRYDVLTWTGTLPIQCRKLQKF